MKGELIFEIAAAIFVTGSVKSIPDALTIARMAVENWRIFAPKPPEPPTRTRGGRPMKPAPYPYLARIRIIGGHLAGKTGRVLRCYTGRPGTDDRALIELDGSMPGYSVSVLLTDIDAAQ